MNELPCPSGKPCGLPRSTKSRTPIGKVTQYRITCSCGFIGPERSSIPEAILATTTDAVPKGVVAWLISDAEGNDDFCNNREALFQFHYRGGDPLPLGVLPFDGGEGVSPELQKVVDFLMGTGPLEGVYFGERPPQIRRADFWWRDHLRTALSHLPPATPRKGEG